MEYQNELNRCVSLVKWDPSSAIHDMLVLREEANSSNLKEKMWIRAAKEINNFLNAIEKTRFYNQTEFWKNKEPTRLEI
jgi:hypothetical protein